MNEKVLEKITCQKPARRVPTPATFSNIRFSPVTTSGRHSRTRGGFDMSPSACRTSAQYSGRAAMMAKVASLAGDTEANGGAPVRRLIQYSIQTLSHHWFPRRHTVAFPSRASRPVSPHRISVELYARRVRVT